MIESLTNTTGVAILGSTGSIGCNSLRVIESLTTRHMRVVALAAGTNVERLADQIATHLPEVVSVDNETAAHDLRAMLFTRDVDLPRIVIGETGLIEVATHPEADCVISATVGAVGFVPTLVMAGELMTQEARKSGAELLPVDSEHNALHQCLRGERREEVRRIILTASGGPFRTKNKAEMEHATVEEAMQHPTWNMGAKITIDSATLMNKGLEVIEARWLFDFGPGEIDIVVHPESVVHSMIEMIDGSVIAQMGVTDMRHAIQYALTYPERHSCQLPPLDLTAVSGLHFEAPDLERFPCIKLAYRALSEGGTLPAAMNAANEEAVSAFLNERIRLTEIPQVIETVMNDHVNQPAKDIETILDADHHARHAALVTIEEFSHGFTRVHP
jgi:1-deoxy-D-xylulose-5-phosphate reductoisomerase